MPGHSTVETSSEVPFNHSCQTAQHSFRNARGTMKERLGKGSACLTRRSPKLRSARWVASGFSLPQGKKQGKNVISCPHTPSVSRVFPLLLHRDAEIPRVVPARRPASSDSEAFCGETRGRRGARSRRA